MRVGIVGAGISGAYLAFELTAAGHEVCVFEKSRGLGGRLATRRGEGLQFDHGAPFITARTGRFKQVLKGHQQSTAEWSPKVTTLSAGKKPYKRDWFEPHYVGQPKMSALCSSLLSSCDVHLQHQVVQVRAEGRGCRVDFQEGATQLFDWVISTAPAEQTAALMPVDLSHVAYDPSFAVFGEIEDHVSFDAAVVLDSPLAWIEFTHRKPGRVSRPTLVAQSTRSWASDHFDVPLDEVKPQLELALNELGLSFIGVPAIHRWRYAHVSKPHDEPFWLDADRKMAACGDWGLGPTVEDAFSSAHQLLEHWLQQIT